MSESTNGTMEIAGMQIDYGRLHENVVREAVRRALRHVLQNEVDSRASSLNEKRAKDGQEKWDEDELELVKDELKAKHVESFYDGTWGTATRGPTGPRISSFDAEYDKLVRSAARDLMNGHVKAGSIKWNKEAKRWEWFANGQLTTRTLDEAAAGFVANPRNAQLLETLREQANEAVAAKAREREGKAEIRKAMAGSPVDLAELGI